MNLWTSSPMALLRALQAAGLRRACLVTHPLWGHRGRILIDHLVASGWADH